jgi:uncharacterized membrane protein YGL010W
MKKLNQHLAQYAAYHRDRRNIATHFIGIPIIVFAVLILLSRPALDLAAFSLTPALLVAIITTIFYIKLDLRYGVIMGILLLLGVIFASPISTASQATWLGWGIGMFAIGWIIQFVGHYYEGKKPAFADDLMGLAIGPLFVAAELGFLLGLRPEVEKAIIHNVGPTRIRDLTGS